MARTRTLPTRPSLESLKKQAKTLLRAWRRGDSEARARVEEAHPKPGAFASLRDAQLVVAREYGLAGWSDLLEVVEAARLAALGRDEQVAAFLEHACLAYQDDHPRRRALAQRMLDADPTLARASVHAAAAASDVDALQALLAADPAAAARPGGPRSWPPLVYLTYARLPRPVGDAVRAASLLLDAGADANASVRLFGKYRFSALTGAMGEGEAGRVNTPPHPQARALAELLLGRGADPNEAQGLYNTHFTPGDAWLELLLAHGLTAEDRVNWESGEGAIGTLDFLLGVAVTRGFPERVALLLSHGADPNGRNFYDDRLHYENALLYGRPEIAELLLARGARRVELDPAAAFWAACMAADEGRARRLLEARPDAIDDARSIHEAVRFGSDDAVRLLFDLGASLDARGEHFGETPLHRAAVEGRDALALQLVGLGARLDVREPSFDATPVSWAHEGGHLALRDRLLDHCEDVFDLTTWGRVDQLRRVLERDPTAARRTRARGATVLHRIEATGEEAAAVIDLVLARGADLHARMDDGTTPLAAAEAAEHDEVAELLRERGASASG